MIYKVILSPRVPKSLEEIHDYIARDNPKIARKFTGVLRRSIKSLARIPGRCPLARENRLGSTRYRHLLHGNYRIIFAIEGNLVYVVDVRHGARLPLTKDSLKNREIH
jgi:plasmid stabilization system protein ParE